MYSNQPIMIKYPHSINLTVRLMVWSDKSNLMTQIILKNEVKHKLSSRITCSGAFHFLHSIREKIEN